MSDVETAADEPREVPAVEIRQMFVRLDETERVEVPGWPGAWVELRMMDKFSMDEFLSAGQTWIVDAEKISAKGDIAQTEIAMKVAKQNLDLVLSTVTDYQFTIQKPNRSEPGEFISETVRPPRAGKGVDGEKARRDDLRRYYTGKPSGGITPMFRFHPDFADWLVHECRRINGLLPEQEKNEPSSSGS